MITYFYLLNFCLLTIYCTHKSCISRIDKIWKTTNDALAKKFRYELRKSGFNGDFMVVYSKEEPICENLGSFMGVTATFGNFLASYVVKKLIEKE